MAKSFTPNGKKVTGTKKKDKIVWQKKSAWKKNLTVYGLNGNDTIDFSKSTKSNIFYGGKGNDVIKTGTGKKNTVIINKGDGNDTIYTKGKATLVQFNSSSKSDKMAFSKSGKDLILSYTYAKTKKPQIITFKNYFNSNGTVWKQNISVKQAKTTKKMDALLNTYGITMTSQKPNAVLQGTPYKDTITGSTFNGDKIYGGANNDLIKGNFSDKGTKYIDGGDGNDTIYGADGNNNTNTILGGNGDDVIYEGGTNGTTKNIIDAGSGNDIIHLGSETNTVNAGAGDDKILVEGGINTINGGAGNNEIHIHRPMFYTDFDNTIVKGGGTDTLFLDNLNSFDQFGADYDGNDLKVFDSVGDVILKDFKNGHSVKYVSINGEKKDISNIIISQESTLNGTSGDDIFIANNATKSITATQGGNDTIYSGSNTNRISLGTGNNTVYVDGSPYVFLNTGDDTIYTTETNSEFLYITGNSGDGGPENGGNDVIHWRGGKPSLLFYKTDYDDIVFTRENGSDDLVLRYGDNNSVTLKDYYKAGNEDMADLKLSSNNAPFSSWPTLAQIIENKNGVKTMISGLTGTDADEYIIGTGEGEIILGNAGNDFIDPKGGADEIHLGAGNDFLYAREGNKTIYADSGNNIINLGVNINKVTLGTGSDTIVTSSTGINRIIFVEGDIVDDTFVFNGGTNVLDFSTNSFSELLLDNTGDELLIRRGYAPNERSVTLINTDTNNDNIYIYSNLGQSSAKKLFDLNTTTGYFDSTESQTIATGAGNDSIFTGLGNDIINAGTGNNWITLETADSGNNNTYTYTAGAEDTFVLNDYTDFSGLRFMQTNGDLIVSYKNGDFANNTLTIKNYNSEQNIKFCTKNDDEYSSPVNLTGLMNSSNTIISYTCTEDNHTINASSEESGVNITGCENSDNITGSSYNDIINGKGGSDIINGGVGDDLYTIDSANWGSGLTVISDTEGTADTLRINTTSSGINLFFDVTQTDTVTDGNVSYTKGNDLYINSANGYTYANAKNYTGAKISGYFTDDSIENIYIPSGNDWVNAFANSTIEIIAQNVANWLKVNGYTSTTDSIAEEKQADLIKLYKPVMGSNTNLNGTSGNDIIIANDTTKIINATQGGNDTIYSGSNTNRISLGTGNNTVYVDSDPYVYMNTGDDTIYTTETNSEFLYITGNSGDGGPENGGNDVIYWRGGKQSLLFYKTDYDDIVFTRENGSDDLVLRYGDNNSVTLKDYYKAGNEGMAELKLRANDLPERYTGNLPKLMEIIADKGGVGNDLYSKNINDIWYRNFVINDNSGNDTINIKNNKDSIYIMFNVNKYGNFAEGNDKIYFGNSYCNNTWTTTGTLPDKPESYGCIQINDFDSIETINSNDGYTNTEILNDLKSDVASWLFSANGGEGYDDVASALTSGDDVSTLIAIFNRDSNWQ